MPTRYDGVGNILSNTDKRGTVTTNTYDLLNRLLSSTKPDGNGNNVQLVRNEYDGDGNLIAITDANDHRTQYAYNGRTLQTQTTHPDATNSANSYESMGSESLIFVL